ncbi:hypothetical protein [Sphingomonas parva]|nr:hypothetical protein [Sphingomonas parva]
MQISDDLLVTFLPFGAVASRSIAVANRICELRGNAAGAEASVEEKASR